MCGRFTLYAGEEELRLRFLLEERLEEYRPRYNIAPSQSILAVVRENGKNVPRLFRWGLVPAWAASPEAGFKMINARAETLAEKPAWRRLLHRRRCLIPASGFYEWKADGRKKQPYLIRLAGSRLFAFAGLWDVWSQDGREIRSCTIVTTTPNDRVGPIHSRMPVILTQEAEAAWLDEQVSEPEFLRSLLVPYPEEEMEVFPVSTDVNSPKNDAPHLVERVDRS
jgi:putative SOS response-associated peptidase YedK